MKKPFLLFTLFLLSSIFYTIYIGKFIFLFIFILFYEAAIFLLKIEEKRYYIISGIVMLAGFFISSSFLHPKINSYKDDRIHEAYFTIYDIKYYNDNRCGFYGKLIKVDDDSVTDKIYIISDSSKNYKRGDIIKARIKFEDFNINTNPMLFNEKNYYLSKKIYAKVYMRNFQSEKVAQSSSIQYKIFNFLDERIDSIFLSKMSNRNFTFIKSVLLSNTSLMNSESIEDIRNIGLGHFMAVSGLHISIIAVLLNFLMIKFGINKKYSTAISIIIMLLYAYAINFPVSVMRAIIIFTAVYISDIFFRTYDRINVIFFAMFMLLLLNPFNIYSVGFIFSFATVLGIEVLYKKIIEFFRIDRSSILSSIIFVISISIFIFPIQSYFYNRVNFISLLSNVIIIPILSAGMVLSVLILIFSEILFFISAPVTGFLNSVFSFSMNTVATLNGVKILTINTPSSSIFFMIIYYGAIILLCNFEKIYLLDFEIIKIYVLNIFLIFFIYSLYNYVSRPDAIIYFIDIGQGDCQLIRTRNKNIIIDTGGDYEGRIFSGKNILMPTLMKMNVDTVDYLIITHYDWDHYGNLFAISPDIKIKTLISKSLIGDDRVKDFIKNRKIKYIAAENIDKINLSSTDFIQFHNINKDFKTGNNSSILCTLSISGIKILETGDIEKEVEILYNKSENENIDIIKVPHHGSETSSSIDFLKRVKPDNAVISVGRKNKFSHPSSEVVKRYKDQKINIYRTDKDGMITVYIKNEYYSINRYLKDNFTKLSVNVKLNILLRYIICSSVFFLYVLFFINLYKKRGRYLWTINRF